MISIDLNPSSLAGIGWRISFGFEFVSTIPTTGMFNFLASSTAIRSRLISTTNKKEGKEFISLIPEKNLFNLATSASNFWDSLLV